MTTPTNQTQQPHATDDQALDRRAFRRALGRFATGVCVVTTRDADGVPIGLTVNSFTSVSLNPPLILWCLQKSSANLATFEAATHFAVCILAEPQQEIALRFARESADRFSDIMWRAGTHNLPVLADCAAVLFCRTTGAFEGGDHKIYLGEVETLEETELPPLLFHLGDFGGFKV